jgi:ribosomal protein S18 acetylase RimI-like enzyme
VKERLAGAGDLATVEALTRAAYAHYVPLLGREPLPMTEDYAPRIAAGEVWLLEESHETLGLIVLEDHGDNLMILNIAISPEHQSRGLGRRLLAFAEDEARRRGCRTLKLYTNGMMTRNIAIYRRCGFKEAGRMENPKRPGWIRVNMEKTLAVAEDRRSA